MTNILWEYNNLGVSSPIQIEPLEQLGESTEYEVVVSHDSNKPITECGFYISPYTGEYRGTHSPQKDYERLLWLADNYPGYGLSVRQEYSASGDIDSASSIRLIDLERNEPIDIFTGEQLKITSGSQSGNSIEIISYDPGRKLFLLNTAFPDDVTGQNYEIAIDKQTYFKNKSGSSYNYPIPLINEGGVIDKFVKTSFKIKLAIPKFAISAGSFYFDLNLKFTSLE